MSKNKELSSQQIIKRIKRCKGRVRVFSWVKPRYEAICKKYNTNLEEWVSKQTDLPDDDHGKEVVKILGVLKKTEAKIKYYEELLAIRLEQEKQAEQNKDMSQAPAYPEVVQVVKTKKPKVNEKSL